MGLIVDRRDGNAANYGGRKRGVEVEATMMALNKTLE